MAGFQHVSPDAGVAGCWFHYEQLAIIIKIVHLFDLVRAALSVLAFSVAPRNIMIAIVRRERRTCLSLSLSVRPIIHDNLQYVGAIILSTLLYGADVWSLTATLTKSLDAAHHRWQRSIPVSYTHLTLPTIYSV